MSTTRDLEKHRMLDMVAEVMAGAGKASCVTVGQPFEASRLSLIQLGRTKEIEILHAFGEPFQARIEDNGLTWTYIHYRFKLLGPEERQDLRIHFNPDGTVKSYSFNSDGAEDSPKKL